MNCQEVNFIVDARAPEELSPADKQAVELHLMSCQVCRDAWAAYRELAAEQPPHTPRDLRPRIAAALAARAPETRWPRRSLLLGGALLVGAAVAAGIALHLVARTPDLAWRGDEPLPAAAPTLPDAPEIAPVAGAPVAGNRVDDIGSAADAAPPGGAMKSPAAFSLDPHSMVVVVVQDPTADPQAAAEFAKCREQVLQRLRAVEGLNVIAGERVSAFDGFNLPAEEIARELGAGTGLILKTLNQQMSCSATQFDPQTGVELPVWIFADSVPPPDGWKSFAAGIAGSVRDATLKGTSIVVAEAQAAVLNTALSDLERATALFKLRHGPDWSLEAYDSAIIAAAAQIATMSRDAEARETAWTGLRRIRDPYLVQPLLHSLANDPAEIVRRAAALALAEFVEEPGVRAALARAAADDPSDHRAVGTRDTSVREAARRALLSKQELRDSELQNLINGALTDRDRLEPLFMSTDGLGPVPVELDDEAARVVFDMGRRSEDLFVRAQAWYLLGKASPNPDFVQALLDDLTSHPDDTVRGVAAAELGRYTDDPRVRGGLERAIAEDASQNVQRKARTALDSVDR